MSQCTTPGCDNAVSKPGYKLCLQCWKQQKGRGQQTTTTTPKQPKDRLTATDIGKHFGLKAARINLLLSELGWIARGTKGWQTTAVGESMGAGIRHIAQTGVPFAVWNPAVLDNTILIDAVKEYRGDNASASQSAEPAKADAAATPAGGDFRAKFPANFRATDGHFVRSKAEMLIDNYLYTAGIVHAYERKLPVGEDVYCDFYLPQSKVYIEYWGMENNPAYRSRKEQKLAVYKKYAFNLIELGDDEVQNLDDHMPRLLLAFGITVD